MKISKIFFAAISGFILLSFVACGPVKFSSSSNQTPTDDTVKEQTPPTGTDPDPGTGTGATRDVTTTHVVEANQDKVDILLIVDNSSSMNADNIKLADRLTTFVTQ